MSFIVTENIKRQTPKEVIALAKSISLTEIQLGHKLIDFKVKGWSWLECALFIKVNQNVGLINVVKTMNENIAWYEVDNVFEEPKETKPTSDKKSKNQEFIDCLVTPKID